MIDAIGGRWANLIDDPGLPEEVKAIIFVCGFFGMPILIAMTVLAAPLWLPLWAGWRLARRVFFADRGPLPRGPN